MEKQTTPMATITDITKFYLNNLIDDNCFQYLIPLQQELKIKRNQNQSAFKVVFNKLINKMKSSSQQQVIQQLLSLKQQINTEKQCYEEFYPVLEKFVEQYKKRISLINQHSGIQENKHSDIQNIEQNPIQQQNTSIITSQKAKLNKSELTIQELEYNANTKYDIRAQQLQEYDNLLKSHHQKHKNSKQVIIQKNPQGKQFLSIKKETRSHQLPTELSSNTTNYKKQQPYNPNKYIREMYKHEPKLHHLSESIKQIPNFPHPQLTKTNLLEKTIIYQAKQSQFSNKELQEANNLVFSSHVMQRIKGLNMKYQYLVKSQATIIYLHKKICFNHYLQFKKIIAARSKQLRIQLQNVEQLQQLSLSSIQQSINILNIRKQRYGLAIVELTEQKECQEQDQNDKQLNQFNAKIQSAYQRINVVQQITIQHEISYFKNKQLIQIIQAKTKLYSFLQNKKQRYLSYIQNDFQ